MKLYFSPGACSLAPNIALHELGLKFEAVKVDLRAKQSAEGDYTKINPKGYVPALRLDSGEILTEGAVILQYIADQKPDLNLIPRAGTMERYRCQEWLNFISTEVHKGFSPLWNPATPEDVKASSKERLGKRFDYLAAHFATQPFLMGNQYTVADIYLFNVLGWTKPLNFNIEKWPALLGFMERVSSRPAVAAAYQAEGLKK